MARSGHTQPTPPRPFPAPGTESPAAPREVRVAVVGNPNSGKTTLFNALTGLHQRTGNYPGVTVEKKEGAYSYHGQRFRLLDLPGTYSLKAASEDECVVRDTLLRLRPHEPDIDMVLVVVDASHLERHLYLASQVLDLGLPVVLALTMNDEADRSGRRIDSARLAAQLGVPVVEVIVPRQHGLAELKQALLDVQDSPAQAPPWRIGGPVLAAVDQLAAHLGRQLPRTQGYLREAALQLLTAHRDDHPLFQLAGVRELVAVLRAGLDRERSQWRAAEASGRYAWISEVISRVAVQTAARYPTRHDRLDGILTHPVWGLLVFAVVMAVVFQAVFSWSAPFMSAIDSGFGWLADEVIHFLPPGPLAELLAYGVIQGVGAVVVFLPQILFLFFFIAMLEDTGYMARAAFLMNRHMRRAGLHGRAFIPLLSGFACSVPGIMAARTIPDPRDRLVTILVTPLISCSARLPVYALMIAAFIPATKLLPGFTLQGLTLWTIYLFSVAAAITAAFILRKTILRGETQAFILELPPYRLPHWKTVLAVMWDRGRTFLVQAGTIILAMNILLWFLLAFPRDHALTDHYQSLRATATATLSGETRAAALEELDHAEAAEQMRFSLAGRLGRLLEPALRPLGFDWKIGIGLIGSFAAREVFVSTMAVVYGVGAAVQDDRSLVERIKGEIDPRTGQPVYNTIVGLNIILFFVLACQCMATLAVVKRETNSWKWPLFMLAYMTGAAYLACLVFYQVAGRLAGVHP